MADLLARPALRLDEQSAPQRPIHVAALQAAGWAAGVGLVLAGGLVVVAWAAGGAPGRPGPVVAAVANAWLVGHGSGLVVDGVDVGLVPWGLAVVPLLLLHRAGRWAAVASRTAGLRDLATGTAVGAAAYGTLGAVLAAAFDQGAAAVRPPRALLATTVVAAVGLGSGLLREAGLWRALLGRVPQPARRALHAGGLAAATVLAGGALLVLLALVTHLGRVHGLLTGLSAGVLGGLAVTLVGAALLPNAAVWAASYCLGPGFAVGVGTSVATGGVRLGEVPSVPVLGALPASVPALVSTLALLVPVLAGAAAGVVLHRAPRPALRDVVLDAAATGAVAGLLLGVAAALSGGPAGDGRLTTLGPVAWQVAGLGALEVAAAAGVTALLLRWRDAA